MMDVERFNALIERYLNGTLDDAAGEELRQAIETSAELREQLHTQICMDILLARRFAIRNGSLGRSVRAALRDPTQKKGAITRIMDRLAAKPPKKNSAESSSERAVVAGSEAGIGSRESEVGKKVLRFPATRSRFSSLLYAASAAALVAVALSLYFWKRGAAIDTLNAEELAWAVPAGTQPVATASPESASLATVRRNGKDLILKKVRPLLTGDILVTAGGAEVALSYPDKTRVKIPGEAKLELQPTVLQTDAGISIDLMVGALDADVSPQTRPMIVLTPLGRAVIAGTRFTLTASAVESRLEVLDGQVRLSSASTAESVMVHKGESAVLSANSRLEATPATRDPARWPFSAKSPWNYPLCAGAKFVPVESPRFDADKGVTVAVDEDSIPIYIATLEDPERIVFRTTKDKNKTLRLPLDAKPEPSLNHYMNVIDEKHFKVYEMRGAQLLNDGSIKVSQNMPFNSVQENDGVYTNDASHGTRAYGGSSLGGIVRAGELGAGIRHALGVGVVMAALNQNAPSGKPYVWPASHAAIDWDRVYGTSGNLHLGTLLAIPPNVDLAKIGVGTSGPAYEIARALQDYGAYIVDHAEESATDLKFYVEPAAKKEIPKGFEGQLARVMRFLQVVANNTPSSIGGGGKPRRAFAPPFAKEFLVPVQPAQRQSGEQY